MNIRRINLAGLAITLITLIAAIIWAFPLYWAVVTTLKPEFEVVEKGFRLLPKVYTLAGYVFVMFNTKIGLWYVNSMITSLAVTVLVVSMAAACGYAISQLRFPGRTVLWLMILASFMVPIQTLIVSHFVLMNDFGLINNLAGVVLPQLIAPVTVIVYKQFFDSISKEYREAAVIDGAKEYQIFFHIFLRMNWGVTTALAIITFIGAWNNFLWPFLAVTQQERMNVTVGITQVDDAFGLAYARNLSGAVLAALPVALAYLIFQRRVTQAIMLSAGVKG
jgi:multiple sugar transport system permease protein